MYPQYTRGTIKGKKAYWNKKIKDGDAEMPPRPKGLNMEELNLTPEQESQDEALTELLQYLSDKGVPISPEDKKLVRSFKVWEMGYKDGDGEGQSQLLHSVELAPDMSKLQADVIRQAPPVKITPTKYNRVKSKDKRYAIVPDMQMGYRRHDSELEPMHDESVVNVGLQIIRHYQPDLIVLNGDNLDLPDLSHFPPDSKHFQQVMQATVDRLYMVLAEMRAGSPDADIVWLAGNHEDRLRKQILKHNQNLWGVKRPQAGEDFTWLSIPHLMNLESLDVQYVDGYPANRFMINDRLQVIHGQKIRSSGSTAELYTKDFDLSTWFGHVHRIEQHSRTTSLGRVITAMSAGTWARLDGAVPSYHNAVTDDGNVVPVWENWQHGVGVGEYQEGDKPWTGQTIHIDHNEDYQARFDDKVFKPKK